MTLDGVKVIILGVLVMALDSFYFAYYYLSTVGFGNPYKRVPDFSLLEFWSSYFFASVGGVFTGLFIVLMATGFLLLTLEQKRSQRRADAMVKEFLNKIGK